MSVVWTIVVAGGAGERFGVRKQFALLGGRPVVAHAITASRHVSDGVVLVVPADAGADVAFGADVVVAGGPTRSSSVRQGLAQVPDDADVIVVHDAARPLASGALFHAVIEAVTVGGADGAVPGLPVSDTLKHVSAEGVVLTTVDRGSLVAVQTPQAFRAEVLRRAHAEAGDATDDAALVEALGATVRVVAGDAHNVKITTPDDLRQAERLVSERG